MDDGRPKNDDIFLNIARSDSGRRDSLGRSDFRRVSAEFPLRHGRWPCEPWYPPKSWVLMADEMRTVATRILRPGFTVADSPYR